MRQRRTLEEMAADAAVGGDGQIRCPKCACTDFRVYGKAQSKNHRYKFCRHCGHRVLTATTERIIRDVDQRIDGDVISLRAV